MRTIRSFSTTDISDFNEKGGNKGMGESFDRGHIVFFSFWDDAARFLLFSLINLIPERIFLSY